MFIKGQIIDATVNFEIYKIIEKLEMDKGDKGNLNKITKPAYNTEDPVFPPSLTRWLSELCPTSITSPRKTRYSR